MNKEQINYISLILNNAYLVGVDDCEIKNSSDRDAEITRDYQRWAENCAKELDRMATPKVKVKRHTCHRCKTRYFDNVEYYKGWSDRDAEIIRCKDCICHRIKKTPDNKLYFDLGFCEIFDMHTKDDDYCSNAIRKDEEE